MYFPTQEKCTAYSYQNPWMMKEDKQVYIKKLELVKNLLLKTTLSVKKRC